MWCFGMVPGVCVDSISSRQDDETSEDEVDKAHITRKGGILLRKCPRNDEVSALSRKARFHAVGVPMHSPRRCRCKKSTWPSGHNQVLTDRTAWPAR